MKEILGLEIGRKWFQVQELTAAETKSWVNHINYNHKYDYADIYDAYKNPSEAKVSVWNKWVNWWRDVNIFDDTYEVHNLRIGYANCQLFSVVATVREFDVDENGNYLAVATYIMVATKFHNYLYKLASDENESGDNIDLCW